MAGLGESQWTPLGFRMRWALMTGCMCWISGGGMRGGRVVNNRFAMCPQSPCPLQSIKEPVEHQNFIPKACRNLSQINVSCMGTSRHLSKVDSCYSQAWTWTTWGHQHFLYMTNAAVTLHIFLKTPSSHWHALVLNPDSQSRVLQISPGAHFQWYRGASRGLHARRHVLHPEQEIEKESQVGMACHRLHILFCISDMVIRHYKVASHTQVANHHVCYFIQS